MDFKNTIEFPEDKEIPVWRYLSFGKFMDLLSSSSIFFCRADKFIDQYEGFVNRAANNRINSEFQEFENAEEMRQELRQMLKKLKELTLINCWTLGYSDSLAMWNSYCPGNEGVAIKSKVERLKNSFNKYKKNSIHIRLVNYLDIEKEESYNLNGIELFTFKRPQFAYENELRLIIMNIDEFKIGNKNSYSIEPVEYGENIPIDFNELIEEIYISPTSSDWFKKLIERVVKLLYDKPILRSTINAVPR